MSRNAAGVETRHARSCPARVRGEDGERGECRCRPSYQASVYDTRSQKVIKKTFPTLSAARAWRGDAGAALRRGEFRAPTRRLLRDVASEMFDAMERGEVLAKGGHAYKASAIASYRSSLSRHVLDDLGAVRLGDIDGTDVQALVDRLIARGLSGQTVRNAVTALGVVYRYAKRRGWVNTNPARDLELPAGGRRRERIVDPGQSAALLFPLPVDLRALYGVAIFAGLRRGEIAGLGWEHVDFAASAITVERAYCWRAGGFVAPKSSAGARTVPMVGPLAGILLEYRTSTRGEGLLFPSAGDRCRPFDPRSVARRAETAWRRAAQEKSRAEGRDPKEAAWERLVLHEGRHSAASAFIASGLDAVRVSKWMGHSQTSTTLDLYAKAFAAREKDDTAKVSAFYEAWGAEPAHAANVDPQ
jgi:integrase